MIISGPSRRPETAESLLGPSLASQLDRLDVRSKRLFAGKLPGERRSKKRGQSVEFAEHRQYADGDDLRFIDWNVYARLDRLFVKLFMEEEDLALHVVVDASASMDTPAEIELPTGAGSAASGSIGINKKLFAARIASALGYIGLTKQNRVGLTVFGTPGRDRPSVLPDARGRSSAQRLVRFVIDNAWPESTASSGPDAAMAPGEANSLNSALNLVARSRVGKGVLVVLSDFFTPAAAGYEPGLRSIAAVAGAGGFDVYCLQVLSPGELQPELLAQNALDALSGDVRLTDSESGRSSEVTITAPLIREYKRRLAHYCEGLESFCEAREMHFARLVSDADPAMVIAQTLRRLGMVG